MTKTKKGKRLDDIKPNDEYEIRYTEKGEPYFFSKNEEDNEFDDSLETIELAKKEFVREKLSFFTLPSELGRKMGNGIMFYFDFMYWICFLNLLLFIIQLVNYLYGTIYKYDKYTFQGFPDLLFASNYKPEHVWVWRITNIVGLILIVIYPFLYGVRLCIGRKKLQAESIGSSDVIIYVHKPKYVFCRRLTSYSIVALGLFIQLIISFGITLLQDFIVGLGRNLNQDDPILKAVPYLVSIGSICIGLVITITNKIYQGVAIKLNAFEKYSSWKAFRLAYIIKNMLFKSCQLFFVGIAKAIGSTHVCPIRLYGYQYLWILIMDLTLWNAVEFFLPIISTVLKKKFKKQYDSDEDLRDEFDVGEEYLEILYRQLIIYYAMVSFPMASLIGFISAIVEYWLDKFRLVHVSRRPKNVVAGRQNQLTIVIIWIVIGLQAVLNPGGGGVYLLVSEYFLCGAYRPSGWPAPKAYCKTKCPIFFGHNLTLNTVNGTVHPFSTGLSQGAETLGLGWFGKF
eukprot:gene2767-4175_t